MKAGHAHEATMKLKYIILTIIILGGIALYQLDPSQYALMPKCPFKTLTGWSCPGCGIQRAFYAVLHGDFRAAVGYNWFLVFSLPYCIGLIAAHWFLPLRWKTSVLRLLEHRYLIYTYIVLFMVWWVVRNLLHI